ncbi:MAG: hypothetical protein RIM99_10880 [Cyclobacteriaceae bacterium]
MNDVVLYSISDDGFWKFQFILVYFIFLLIVNLGPSRDRIKRFVRYLTLTVAFLICFGVTILLWIRYSSLKWKEQNNECEVAVGIVSDFKEGPNLTGSFVINDKKFTYPGRGSMGNGFKWDDAEIKNGQKLRVCSYEGIILRIEKIR